VARPGGTAQRDGTMWQGMGKQPDHGMQEIDIRTGEVKDQSTLTKAIDYRKWDSIAKRVSEHPDDPEEPEVAEYFWVEMPHADIRVRIPVLGKTKSKQCKVDVKLNWLTVWAPSTESVVGYCPEDAPPPEPLLDFQLYGAVDADECHWELVDDGAVRNIILTLHRRPVYTWPTLHRVNGLRKESDRKIKLAQQKKEWEEEAKAQAKAQKNQQTATYDAMVGPKKPAAFGPEPQPKRRPHRPKDEQGNPLPPVGRPPGVYERGRIIVTEPDYTDSDSD